VSGRCQHSGSFSSSVPCKTMDPGDTRPCCLVYRTTRSLSA
jgi:hypothetical protein